MTLAPKSREELAAALADAGRRGIRVGQVDLGALDRVCRYAPEDLTITVEAGLPFGRLQSELQRHGQWLPIDPPAADHVSIAGLLDDDLSGPRRYGYGTIREHLIGLRVALADGRIIRSGGEVVKNVAGYDLMKLFVGAHGTLGVIVEAAFKLRPRPQQEAFVSCPCPAWEDAARALAASLDHPIDPVVLDLHNIHTSPGPVATLVLGFAGTREEVGWQLAEAKSLGISEPASLDHAAAFSEAGAAPPHRESVLPSRLVDALRKLHGAPFIARAGNGVFYHLGPAGAPAVARPSPLIRRVKETFDPANIFPEMQPT